MILIFAQVASGGALGALLRYIINIGTRHMWKGGLPLGTLLINVIGSFLMGALAAWLIRRGHMHMAPFLLSGLLGGFTTFSAFSLDALRLYEQGHIGQAIAYVIASVALSLLAVAAGLWLGRGGLTA